LPADDPQPAPARHYAGATEASVGSPRSGCARAWPRRSPGFARSKSSTFVRRLRTTDGESPLPTAFRRHVIGHAPNSLVAFDRQYRVLALRQLNQHPHDLVRRRGERPGDRQGILGDTLVVVARRRQELAAFTAEPLPGLEDRWQRGLPGAVGMFEVGQGRFARLR